ncbi:MAG: hypothetical protein GY948_02160 [Alphaproteobacteria bacterium]|nr:hypothetical protein [Alphaproteobacteria bacterium]
MRTLFLALGLAFSAATFAPAYAAEFFVPQGHSYAPNDERLPLLNSQRDRVNARAAEIETEIYRRQLKRRRQLERMNAFEDHQFGNRFQRSNTWD